MGPRIDLAQTNTSSWAASNPPEANPSWLAANDTVRLSPVADSPRAVNTGGDFSIIHGFPHNNTYFRLKYAMALGVREQKHR